MLVDHFDNRGIGPSALASGIGNAGMLGRTEFAVEDVRVLDQMVMSFTWRPRFIGRLARNFRRTVASMGS